MSAQGTNDGNRMRKYLSQIPKPEVPIIPKDEKPKKETPKNDDYNEYDFHEEDTVDDRDW